MMTVRWLREQMRQGKSIYDLPLRVTFYARVSTEKVEQQGSLENQIQYYTEFIQKNPNWLHRRGHFRHQHLQAGQLSPNDCGCPARNV